MLYREHRYKIIRQLAHDPRPLYESKGEALKLELVLGETILAYIDEATASNDRSALEWLHTQLWKTFALWGTFASGGQSDSPSVDFIDMSEYVSLALDAMEAGVDPRQDKFLTDYRQGLVDNLTTVRVGWG